MTEWGWVALAYAVTYLSLGGFAWTIAYRLRRARRRLEELS